MSTYFAPHYSIFLEEEIMTTKRDRLIVIAIAGVLLLSGYVFGRVFDGTKSKAADENKATANQLTTNNNTATPAAKESEQFYLSDFKTGYTTGYNSGLAGEESLAANSDRPGYNEGFKQGYADGFKSRVESQNVATSSVRTAPATRVVRERVVYRSAPRKKNSTLNTVLTIAAPAAIGAGVGGAVGGGKGAGVGAALGGGGGALYHLIKNRDKD